MKKSLDKYFFFYIIDNDYQNQMNPANVLWWVKCADIMQKEFNIFFNYLKQKGLKHTAPREKILKLFLKLERHISADDLYRRMRKVDSSIGFATVYRTLKLIADAGLASEVDFGDRVLRLEHKFNHQHHDHLICLKCGRLFEVLDPAIERLQEQLAKKQKFTPLSHKMEIFGYCFNCRKNLSTDEHR